MPTILVIGASGGIGRGIALRMARDGWDVLAHGRDKARLVQTQNLVAALGVRCDVIVGDLTNVEDVDAIAAAANAVPDFAALVFCAGTGQAIDSGPEALSEWDRTLAALLHAPMRLTALTLPKMKQAGGAYLYLCGMFAKIGSPRKAAHCAGRHGLEGFAKALFEEVREDGVRVTMLHPGFVNTTENDPALLDGSRMIQVEDIAEMTALALNLPASACVSEMVVRPQRSPYVKDK